MEPVKQKSSKSCPVCGSDNTRLDFDFPDTMSCCDKCGCDFITDDLEIIFNPNDIK